MCFLWQKSFNFWHIGVAFIHYRTLSVVNRYAKIKPVNKITVENQYIWKLVKLYVTVVVLALSNIEICFRLLKTLNLISFVKSKSFLFLLAWTPFWQKKVLFLKIPNLHKYTLKTCQRMFCGIKIVVRNFFQDCLR